MLYYIKNIKLNSKSLKLLKKKEIEELKILESNYSNMFSSYSISKLLFNGNNTISNVNINKSIEEDSSEEIDNKEEDNEINEISKNLELINLENNEIEYYLNLIMKDIDLDNLNKEIKFEISNEKEK